MIKLYSSLAKWWPVMSGPHEYTEEAAVYEAQLLAVGSAPAETLVEFGSGGGNNASHMKRTFRMTLVDASPEMLAVSRKLNPDCEHVLGDMRSVRLGLEFDRVFIHDAICYMTSLADLRQAMETAFVHCRPGGAALVVPDFVTETFVAKSDHGGCDGPNGGMRWVEWIHEPDPSSNTYVVDYAYLLKDPDGTIRAEHDRHVEGLFGREEWLATMRSVGFSASLVPHDEGEMFVGLKAS